MAYICKHQIHDQSHSFFPTFIDMRPGGWQEPGVPEAHIVAEYVRWMKDQL